MSAPTAAPSGRVSLIVDAKQNSLKRQRTSETARLYNKDKKSAVATRVKKVRCLMMRTLCRASVLSSLDADVLAGTVHMQRG